MSARQSRSESSWPWVEGLFVAAFVLWILANGGDAVRASYHGYTHVAIGEAVLRDGLAPENPYHAGTPLRYYTLYPLIGVAIGRTGMGPMWAFVAINVVSALLFAPALDTLGRALGLAFGARRACFWAAFLGFNGWGWIGYLFAGFDAFGRTPVYALAPMTFARASFGWDPRLQAFLPKFLNVSSYAIALPFALWALAPCVRGEGVRLRTALAAGVSAGLSLALNPLVGGLAGACMAVWLAPTIVRGPWRARLTLFAAGAVALALAAPFLPPALAPAPTGPELFGNPPLGGSPIANLLGPLMVLVVPGVLGWKLLPGPARWRWCVAAIFAAILVLAGEMPQGNEYKMARLSGMLWALPAGAWCATAIAGGGMKRYLVWVVAVLCVPTTLAVPRAYSAWGAQAGALPLRVEHGRLAPDPMVVQPAIPEEVLAAEAQADAHAVLVLAPFRGGPRGDTGIVQGNPLAPALHHTLFVDVPQIHNDGHPDLRERLDCATALWSGRTWDGRPFAPAQALARVREICMDRTLLFLTPDASDGVAALIASLGGQALARAGGYALWSLPALRSPGR